VSGDHYSISILIIRINNVKNRWNNLVSVIKIIIIIIIIINCIVVAIFSILFVIIISNIALLSLFLLFLVVFLCCLKVFLLFPIIPSFRFRSCNVIRLLHILWEFKAKIKIIHAFVKILLYWDHQYNLIEHDNLFLLDLPPIHLLDCFHLHH